MRIRFLGTGTSHGVPVLGCGCPVCSSADPRDTRYRSSVLVSGDEGERILIDAGPEFRLQALAARLSGLDALLVTHAHADHVHGIDDVRPLTRGRPLPVYASGQDVAELRHRFSYAFSAGQAGGGKPRLELVDLDEPGGPDPAPRAVRVGSVAVRPVPLMHGERRVLGYRLGGLAYGIYLSHFLFIKVAEAVGIKLGLPECWQWAVGIWLIAAVGSTLLAWTLSRSRLTRWLVA